MSIELLKAEYEATPREQRQGALRKIYEALNGAPKNELDHATQVLLPLLNAPSPNEAADVALTLGALVEAGADPGRWAGQSPPRCEGGSRPLRVSPRCAFRPT